MFHSYKIDQKPKLMSTLDFLSTPARVLLGGRKVDVYGEPPQGNNLVARIAIVAAVAIGAYFSAQITAGVVAGFGALLLLKIVVGKVTKHDEKARKVFNAIQDYTSSVEKKDYEKGWELLTQEPRIARKKEVKVIKVLQYADTLDGKPEEVFEKMGTENCIYLFNALGNEILNSDDKEPKSLPFLSELFTKNRDEYAHILVDGALALHPNDSNELKLKKLAAADRMAPKDEVLSIWTDYFENAGVERSEIEITVTLCELDYLELLDRFAEVDSLTEAVEHYQWIEQLYYEPTLEQVRKIKNLIKPSPGLLSACKVDAFRKLACKYIGRFCIDLKGINVWEKMTAEKFLKNIDEFELAEDEFKAAIEYFLADTSLVKPLAQLIAFRLIEECEKRCKMTQREIDKWHKTLHLRSEEIPDLIKWAALLEIEKMPQDEIKQALRNALDDHEFSDVVKRNIENILNGAEINFDEGTESERMMLRNLAGIKWRIKV